MQQLLKKIQPFLPKRPHMEVELFLTRAHLLHLEFKDRTLDLSREAEDVGVGLRLFSQGRLGCASTTRLDAESLGQMVTEAQAHLQSSDPIFPRGVGPAKKAASPSNVPGADRDSTLAGIARSRKIDVARELEAAALAADPRIRRVRGACYEEGTYEVLAQPFGGDLQYGHRDVMSLSLLAVAEDQDQAESSWSWDYATDFERLNPRKVAEEAAREAVAKLGARSIATQRCPVILSNMIAGEILGLLASSFLGDRQIKGLTPFKNRIGERIYSEKVTIVDDGKRAGGFVSFPFDGEGMPTQSTTVVDSGRFKGFLYDRVWGEIAQTGTTGNGVRGGMQDPPAPGVTNIFIQPGTLAPAKVEQMMGTGLQITDLIGLHTANPITGDFSLGASGHWIENGERRHAVRGIAVSGNFHDILAKVEAVGSDLRFYGGTGSPSLLISAIDVGGI